MSEPSFYAIIPATVRYHADLCPNAKLLYGEITALTQKQGFCWATNGYFKDLYGVSASTISEWVGQLRKAGFIKVEIDAEGGNRRKIWIVEGMAQIPKTSSGKAEHIITGDITTKSIDARSTRFIPPSIEECRTEAQNNSLPSSEGDAFFDRHTTNGWIPTGQRTQMKDWRAAMRTWKRNHEKFNPAPVKGTRRNPICD